VDYSITALAFGVCIVYSCFVGDTFTSLLQGAGLPPALASRESAIIGVTVAVLFPLTLLRVGVCVCVCYVCMYVCTYVSTNTSSPPSLSPRHPQTHTHTRTHTYTHTHTHTQDLSALQYSSYVGILAVIYTVIFVAIRYVDGSYFPGE
jgi:amino acid permease